MIKYYRKAGGINEQNKTKQKPSLHLARAIPLIALHSQSENRQRLFKEEKQEKKLFSQEKIYIFVKGSLLKNVISRLLPCTE